MRCLSIEMCFFFKHIMSATRLETYCTSTITEHTDSAIGTHLVTDHGVDKSTPIEHLFKVHTKCKNKFDCSIYEMFLIRDIKPNLNAQSASIRAKCFT